MKNSKVIESFIIHARMQGCFSRESMAIEVITTEDGSTLRMAHKNGYEDEAMLSEAKAEIAGGTRELIDGFLKILDSPQHLPGERSTTVYGVEVEWTVGNSSRKWSLSGSESQAHKVFAFCKKVVTAHQAVGG